MKMFSTCAALLVALLAVAATVRAQDPKAPPPAPPALVPATDPAPENPANLVDAVKGKHPRLLFGAEDIPALKELSQGDGKMFNATLLAYLGAAQAVPKDAAWASNDTEAQRQGFWRLPTVALHYVLTGDKKSFDSAVGYMKKFLETDHWQTDTELDSGMGAANIATGAALAYDWLYHDLDPQFREAFAKKLLLQARRQYYGGHLNRNNAIGYWQGDPQNNHRWHRNSGLTLCALAVAGDIPGTEWIVAQTKTELEFVNKWLPPDGTCHESPSYMIFGTPYLVLASQAADRCLGTHLLAHPFFKNNVSFRLQTLAPGMKDVFGYGDSGGTGSINNFLFKEASVAKDKDLQAAVMRFYNVDPKDSFMFGWFSLIWYDVSLKGGAFKLPNTAFFDDLGMAFIRDGWDEKDVGVMFKCGPYGGYKLNEYRNTNNYHGVNVAHDDPDANTFDLYARGRMFVQDGGYAGKKLTSSENTILINGKGQKGEGGTWTQPLRGKDADMTKLASVLAWKPTDTISAVEGEAGNAYPDLKRYRRTVIFAPGAYVLILDDIRAPKEVEIAWLVQSPKVEIVNQDQKLFRLTNKDVSCDFTMAADRAFATAVVPSTAESKGRSHGWQQLQAKAKTTDWRVATAFNAWNLQTLTVTASLRGASPGMAVIVKAGDSIEDLWDWQWAPDNKTASTLKCTRKDRSIFQFGPADKVTLPVVPGP